MVIDGAGSAYVLSLSMQCVRFLFPSVGYSYNGIVFDDARRYELFTIVYQSLTIWHGLINSSLAQPQAKQ
jgi:hypothetical protein